MAGVGDRDAVSSSAWLVVHLVAVAVLTGVGWVVQLVVYPAFRLVGTAEWAVYHERHMRAISRVVTVPWLAQGVSVVALLLDPGPGGRAAGVALGALALVTVSATVVSAVPAHYRIAATAGGAVGAADVATLLRANLARTLAWTVSTALAAALVRTGVG